MYWWSGRSGVRGRNSVRGLLFVPHYEKPLMILKPVKQTSTAAALKAERDRDMAQAMQDYENEQWAASSKYGAAAGFTSGECSR
jgi:hypothetical protein